MTCVRFWLGGTGSCLVGLELAELGAGSGCRVMPRNRRGWSRSAGVPGPKSARGSPRHFSRRPLRGRAGEGQPGVFQPRPAPGLVTFVSLRLGMPLASYLIYSGVGYRGNFGGLSPGDHAALPSRVPPHSPVFQAQGHLDNVSRPV